MISCTPTLIEIDLVISAPCEGETKWCIVDPITEDGVEE